MPDAGPSVTCFGEILWDFLPGGAFPGGAPCNVAYHLHGLGARVQLVSAVGCDLLGDELLRRLRQWGLGLDGIARNRDRPTGSVRATLGAAGDAHYAIAGDVAWDGIPAGAPVLEAAARADAFVFGSLAQRSAFNRATLDRLLAVLPARALRIFDVNLRAPYDDLPRVRALARQATVLKLNSAEAARLARGSAAPDDGEAQARALAAEFGCDRIVVTAGARGAGLLHGADWTWEPGRPVTVVDTVGAGDAFLASFALHLLAGRHTDHEILARACRLGEWVASRPGATPAYEPATPR